MNMHLNTFNPSANGSGISIGAVALKPSARFKMLATAVGGIAVLLGFSLPLSLWSALAWVYLAVVAIFFMAGRDNAVHTLRKQKNGLFTLESPLTVRHHMVLQGNSLSTPFACILYFKPKAGGMTQTVLIWSDSVPADVFRRLKGWLRWCAACAE